VGGTVVSMVVVGTVTALGLLLCGIQGWALLGLLTFFGTFVPYVGAVSSSVPGLLVGLSQSPQHFFYALGVYLGVHVIEGYVVQPLVMRRAVEANPALLLFFQAVMGALFGLLGLIVATPLLTVLQIVVTTLWIEGRLHKKPPSKHPPSEERAAGAAAPVH
jgi:predicted PurR-regulated permease PerM